MVLVAADTLIADMCVHDVCESQTEALFDIGVVDTDAWSYCAHTPRDVLFSAEYEKKHKYLQTCRIDVPPLLLSFFVFV